MIVAHTPDGTIVGHTGTNSQYPAGPPDDTLDGWLTELPDDVALLRLHDEEDADAVTIVLTRRAHVTDGRVVDDGPHPLEDLTVAPDEVTAGDTTLVTYTNTLDDAPASVTLDVNGATATVALTDGVAELEVTVAQPGRVTITAVDRPTAPVTVRGV